MTVVVLVVLKILKNGLRTHQELWQASMEETCGFVWNMMPNSALAAGVVEDSHRHEVSSLCAFEQNNSCTLANQ